MSTLTAQLGNVEYIYLKDTDCNGGAGGKSVGIFTWTLPKLPARESSTMFLQVSQVSIHYAGVGTAGNAEPQYLTYENLYSDSMYSSDNSTVLATIIDRDDTGGHWHIESSGAPVIQVSSNSNTITFSVRNQFNNEINGLGTLGSVSILLKIIRPQNNVVRDNTLKGYETSMIGSPPFNRL